MTRSSTSQKIAQPKVAVHDGRWHRSRRGRAERRGHLPPTGDERLVDRLEGPAPPLDLLTGAGDRFGVETRRRRLQTMQLRHDADCVEHPACHGLGVDGCIVVRRRTAARSSCPRDATSRTAAARREGFQGLPRAPPARALRWDRARESSWPAAERRDAGSASRRAVPPSPRPARRPDIAANVRLDAPPVSGRTSVMPTAREPRLEPSE